MSQKKNGQEEYEERGYFRSLLLNYQFVKTLKISDNSRTVQAFDIATKKDVVIRFVRNDVEEHGSIKERLSCMCADRYEKYLMCSTHLFPPVDLKINSASQRQKEDETRDHPWIDQRKVLPVLNHRNIVRQVFCKKFGSYSAICTEYFPGSGLDRGLSEKDILLIIEQLVSIVSYLTHMRISVSEINLRDILVDCKREVRLIRLNKPNFENKVNSSIEKRCMHSLLKILHFLVNGEERDMCHPYLVDTARDCLNKTAARKIDSTELKSIYNLLVGDCTIQALVQVCGVRHDFEFKDRLLVDPVVLLKARELGFTCSSKEYFDARLVNNPSRKEYYLYRLIEENFGVFRTEKHPGTSSKLGKVTSRLTPEKVILSTNRLENAECNAITPQEREKHTSIKHRISVLRDTVYYPSSFRNCMTCAKLGTESSLDLQILKDESFFDIMKILRQMKVSSWRVKDKIKAKEESVGLEIVISLKKSGRILVSKEHGRDIDFLHLVSELIECSRYVG